MPYTTVAEVREALFPGGESDDRGETAASMNDSQLSDAVEEAQAKIDARLASRYAVPWPDGEVPPIVASLTRDLAAYDATLSHRRGQPLAADHPVRLRHDEALALLTLIADGDASIETVPEGTGAVVVQNGYEGDLFGLEDFDLGPAVPTDARWLG